MTEDQKKALENYDKLIVGDPKKARDEILKLKYQDNAYLLMCIALSYRDEAIFFNNGKERKFIKLDKINLAKEFIDKAINISPNCRDVLFIKGTIYDVLDNVEIAIDCFIKIIKNGENQTYSFNCSSSELWYVQMIINDAHLKLYQLFKASNKKLANKFLREYKSNIKRGVKTIYMPLEKFL
jgi:tetratricopeptide (TPR) repeat protein